MPDARLSEIAKAWRTLNLGVLFGPPAPFGLNDPSSPPPVRRVSQVGAAGTATGSNGGLDSSVLFE